MMNAEAVPTQEASNRCIHRRFDSPFIPAGSPIWCNTVGYAIIVFRGGSNTRFVLTVGAAGEIAPEIAYAGAGSGLRPPLAPAPAVSGAVSQRASTAAQPPHVRHDYRLVRAKGPCGNSRVHQGRRCAPLAVCWDCWQSPVLPKSRRAATGDAQASEWTGCFRTGPKPQKGCHSC